MFRSAVVARRIFAFIVASGAVALAGCPDDSLRSETRATLSGRVVLVDVDGLNDLSRVRVDLGNGEGGAIVDDDGVFVVKDLEADVYALTVTYTGGLTPLASHSAYAPFSRRVPLVEAANVDVGDLVLTLATGTVAGHLQLTDAAGQPLAGAEDGLVRLRLDDGSVRSTSVGADGAWSFADVPVGYHVVEADRDGFALPATTTPAGAALAQSDACGVPATIVEADAVVDLPTLQLVQARAGLVPGDGELAASDDAWVLRPGIDRVSVNVVAAYARRVRAWLDDAQASPDFGDDGVLSTAVDVPGGVHTLYVQVTDGCRYTSPLIAKVVIRDLTPPAVVDAVVAGSDGAADGVALVSADAVDVFIDAVDEDSGVDGVAAVVVDAGVDPATLDAASLSFVPVSDAGGAARASVRLALPDEGDVVVAVIARDTAGNVSPARVARLRVDRTPPRIDRVTIGDGRAVTNDAVPLVHVDAVDDGAGLATVQLSTRAVFSDPPRPFAAGVALALDDGTPAGGDGPKTVSIRVTDAAGNASEASASVLLDRRAPSATIRRKDGGTALGGRGPVTLTIDHDEDVTAVGIGLQDTPCGGGDVTAPDSPGRSERVVDVASPDGVVVVHACLRDAASNQTAQTQTFTLDTSPPVGVITVDNGAAFVNHATVDVAVSTAEPGVVARLGESRLGAVPDATTACAGDAGYAAVRGIERVTLGGTGRRVVWACLRDPAGNTGFAVDDIVLDIAAPQITRLLVDDGAAATNDPTATVRVDVTDDGAGPSTMVVSLTGTFADPPRPFAPVFAVALDDRAGDGAKVVSVRVTDGAGNVAEASTSIILDRVAPTGALSRKRGGTTIDAAGPEVFVVDHAADVVAVAVGFADDPCTQPKTAPDSATHSERTLVVDRADGPLAVRACLLDAAGNQTRLSLPLVVDTVTPAGTLVVNNGRAFATSAGVDVVVGSSEQPVLVRLGEGPADGVFTVDAVCAGDTGYVPFRAQDRVVLDGEGARFVYACLRDPAGHTGLVVDDVVLDSVPPVVTAVTLGDGSGVTLRTDVAVRLAVDGASEMKVGFLAGLAGVAWQPFVAESRVVVAPGDGEKTLYFRFRDPAGNESPEEAHAIVLDSKGTIAGRVFVEGRDDASVAEVHVVGTALQAIAAPDGAFTIPNVPAGVYTVEAAVRAIDLESDRFLVAQTGIAVEARQSSTTTDLFVARKRGNVGGVLALESLAAGAGNAGALLELVEAGATATTGQDGAFSFTGIPTGTYTLRASKAGYVTQTVFPVLVEHARTTAVSFVDTLRLVRGSVALRALLEDGGAPTTVQAILTGATNVDAFAGGDGGVRFDQLLPGAYTLSLRATGDAGVRYRAQSRALRVVAGEIVDLGDVALPLARGGLTGIATAESDGGIGPAANVLVEVNGGASVVSDSAGRFTLQGLIAGNVDVRLSQPDHAPVTLNSVAIVDGQTTTMSPSPLLRLRGGVRGRVFLEGGDSPTVVQASLQGETGSARADVDGTFALDGILPGNHVLVIETTGAATGSWDTLTQPITVIAGQRIELPSTTLARARGSIALAVRLEDETDFGGVVVDVTGAGITGVSDALGNVRLEGVPVGTYNLRFTKTNFTARELTGIAVTARATTSLSPVALSLNRGVITGKAIYDDATDFSGITVSLLGSDVTATTDALGDFVLTGVKPGTWNVIAQAASYNSARDNGLFVGPGQAIDLGLLTLSRKRGAVVGRVTVEGAADASGVTVEVLNTGFRTLPQLNGDFSFSIPVGNYDGIVARKEFFATIIDREVITVTDVGNYTVAPIALRGQSGVLRGVVRLADAAVGAEGGSTVTLEGVPGSAVDGVVVRATTLADGSYSFDQPEDFTVVNAGAFALTGAVFPFRGIPIGAYRLTAREPVDAAAGRDIVIRDVVIATAQTTTENVELRKVFITINNGAAFTTNRLVTLTLGATDCFRMRLSVDAAPAPGQAFVACNSPVTNFSLGNADGVHTVFAEFMNSAAELLPVVAASILVDTKANIASFTHDVPSGTKRTFGDSIVFGAETGESGGRAVVNLAGYDSGIVLADLGGGRYGATYPLLKRIDVQPSSPTATSGPGTATLTFVDPVGNVATAIANTTTTVQTKSTSATPIGIGVAPLLSPIVVVPDVVTQTATVRFTTDELASAVVRVGTAEASLCAVNCAATPLGTTHVAVVTGAQASEPGGVLLRNKPYFVRVEATDSKGNLAVSATLKFFIQPDPPSRVVPIAMNRRVLVRWEAPTQEDLSGYFVERSTDGGGFVRISGATPYNHEALLYDDRAVENDHHYVYRVRAVDLFGNASDPGTTTDMAKNADGTTDATKFAAFSACADAVPSSTSSTAGVDLNGGSLPFCAVWTSQQGPVRVRTSTLVPAGGILVIGPGVNAIYSLDQQLIVLGRLAAYGDRGPSFALSNEGFDDVQPLLTNAVPVESTTGMVRMTTEDGAVTWKGIAIRNAASLGTGKISSRGYRSGDILHRVELTQCGAACVDTDSRTHLNRDVLQVAVDAPFVTGAPVFIGGSRLVREGVLISRPLVDGTQVVDSTLLLPRLDISSSPASGSRKKFPNITMSGSVLRASGIAEQTTNVGIWDLKSDESTILRDLRSATTTASSTRTKFTSVGDTVVLVDNAGVTSEGTYYGGAFHFFGGTIAANVRSSTVTAIGFVSLAGGMLGGIATGRPTLPVASATTITASTLETAGCTMTSQWSAGYAFGSSARLTTTTADCLHDNGGNLDAVFDLRDDVTRGQLDLDTSMTGSAPRVRVDGPLVVQQVALKRGVSLVAAADDFEDGALGDAAFAWFDGSGRFLTAGRTLVLSSLLSVGANTFRVRATDANGNVTEQPWDMTVVNDAGLSDAWMWPDRARWHSSQLRFDQLPQRTRAPDVATFRFHCVDGACTTTCSLDGEAARACRSPVEVAHLSAGTHTLTVTPYDGFGQPIDLPQQATWQVQSADEFFGHHALATIDVVPSATSTAVNLTPADTLRAVVTCSVDGRHEVPCGTHFTVPTTTNGQTTHELVVRLRSRTTTQELQQARRVHLNDADDVDADGWIDVDDPCLSGAERGASCADADGDLVDDAVDLCPRGDDTGDVFVSVVAGGRHACALRADGSVYCTGMNTSGQLGDGTFTNRTTPVRVHGIGNSNATRATQIDAGLEFTCAVLADGTVRCWGNNATGQMGDGPPTAGGTNSAEPIVIGGLSDVRKVAAGGGHACALRGDRRVLCWGNQHNGQAGLAITNGANYATPTVVAGLTNVVDISAGFIHSCASLDDRTARCWGENDDGRLGDGDLTGTGFQKSPVVVQTVVDAVGIEAGRGQGCVLRAGGAMSCWGDNRTAGTLGIGSLISQAIAVENFSTGVRKATIGLDDPDSTRATTMCAVTVVGLQCWGRNVEGQLGNGTTSTTGVSTPQRVSGATSAIDVAVGNGFTCMLRNDGTVSCWGRGTEGQLGDGNGTQLLTVPSVSPLSWSPPPAFLGPHLNDANNDGCEDTP